MSNLGDPLSEQDLLVIEKLRVFIETITLGYNSLEFCPNPRDRLLELLVYINQIGHKIVFVEEKLGPESILPTGAIDEVISE